MKMSEKQCILHSRDQGLQERDGTGRQKGPARGSRSSARGHIWPPQDKQRRDWMQKSKKKEAGREHVQSTRGKKENSTCIMHSRDKGLESRDGTGRK